MIFDFKFNGSPEVVATIVAKSEDHAMRSLHRRFPKYYQMLMDDRLTFDVREEPLYPSKIPKRFAGFRPGRCPACGMKDLIPHSEDAEQIQCTNCGASFDEKDESVQRAIDSLLV